MKAFKNLAPLQRSKQLRTVFRREAFSQLAAEIVLLLREKRKLISVHPESSVASVARVPSVCQKRKARRLVRLFSPRRCWLQSSTTKAAVAAIKTRSEIKRRRWKQKKKTNEIVTNHQAINGGHFWPFCGISGNGNVR